MKYFYSKVFLAVTYTNCNVYKIFVFFTADSEDDAPLPTPGKPSLKMRLFQAGQERRDLLCSMFDNKENMATRKKTS